MPETMRAPRRPRPARRLSIELYPEEEGLLRRLRLTAADRGVTVRELVLSALREATGGERETPTGSTEPGAWLLRRAGARREALRALATSGAAEETGEETPPAG